MVEADCPEVLQGVYIMQAKLDTASAEDLIEGRIEGPARIVLDGHTIGYLGQDAPTPRIEEHGGKYTLVVKRLLGVERFEASSPREALRLLVHHYSSTASPRAAGYIISRSRPLASLSPRLDAGTVALAAYALAIYPEANRGGNVEEISLGGSTADSIYATPATSIVRLLERTKPSAGRRLLALAGELRRMVPVRGSRLLAHIAWRLGHGPPYPTLLLIHLALGSRGLGRVRGIAYTIPTVGESASVQGSRGMPVEPLDHRAAMSMASLSEILMPGAGKGRVRPAIVGTREQIARMARAGSIDPLREYTIVVAGRYAGAAPSSEPELLYAAREPGSSFRALVEYKRLRRCKPPPRLDEALTSRNPCRARA